MTTEERVAALEKELVSLQTVVQTLALLLASHVGAVVTVETVDTPERRDS